MKRQTRRMKDLAKRGLVGLLTVSMCLSNVQGIAFADNRVEVGGVKVDGKKVTLNLNGGSLMEAARAALAEANVYDDTYIAVSKDAKTQAAYRALTDGSNPLYELALFSDGELQALEDAGVEIVALIQMDQKQAEAAGNLMPATASEIERSSTKVEFFDPSKDEGKEILLYQPDSLFAGFYDQFSNQLMNASEKEIVSADPSTYELSGDEKLTFLFINHADAGRTFNLELNGESLEKGIKVAKAESVIKGVMSTLDVSGIDETLETPAPETSGATETGTAATEPSNEAATQPSTETAIEPSTEASGSTGESIVILPETGATSESAEIETSAAAQPTDAAANAETGLPAEGQTSTENTEQSAAEKTSAPAENTGIVETIKEVIETIAENANATMMKIERRLGVIRAEAAESDEAVVEAPKSEEAPAAGTENEALKQEETPAAGTENEAPKPEETPVAGTENEAPKQEETPAAGTENEAPKQEETPAAGTENEAPKQEETPAAGTGIEAPKTEETTAAAAIETTAAVKTDMDIALENDRKALLKETRAADLVDSSVASARVLQYTLDDLSKSFWSAEITDRYEVNVFAEDTAFTEAVELELKELAKPEEAAAGEDTLNEKQVEALKAEGSYKNSRSLDIRFVNASGADVEPASAVKVRIKVYKNALPEDADISTMAIKHLAEKEEGIQVDTVAEYQDDAAKTLGSIQPMDAEGKVTTLSEDENAENTEVTVASTGSLPEDVDSVESTFKVESFSAFTITWGVNTAAGVIVHYVDENGNPVLDIPKSEMTFREDLIGKTTDINEYQGGVSGYEFVNAKLFSAGSEFDPNGGTLVSAVKSDAEDEKNVVFYDSNAEEIKKETTTVNSSGRRMARAVSTKETNKQELYLVYRPQVVPVGGEEKPLQLEDPDTSKTLTDKGNGTYDLTLSVTGKSVASSGKTKANVIIVFDSSRSMGYTEDIFTPTNDNSGDQYGLVNGSYKYLYRRDGKWQYWNGWKYKDYTGTRYKYKEGTRLEVAKQAVKSLANTLLDNNNNENQNAIEIALINFATDVKSTSIKYTNYSSFARDVDSINAIGGTNWEAALEAANTYNFNDTDPVYVIFVSDGDPTFRKYANNYPYDWNDDYDMYGNGSSDPKDRNLKAAQEQAKSIVGSNKHLYMVGAFGDATNMRNLNSSGKYYDATDHATLNNAFTDIIQDIQKDLKYIAVSITDGITGLTSKEAIKGKVDAFTYNVTGSELSEAECKDELEKIGKAQYDETTQSVVWNLGDNYKLIPGATYSVSFKVWPKQEAYDVIADLNNGLTTWEKVQTKYPGQFERKGIEPNYSYSLLTNTSASVSYKTIETTNGTEGTPSAEKTGSIQEQPSMPLVSTKMTVQKIWEDSTDRANRPESIDLDVIIKDDDTANPYKKIPLKLSGDSDIWTETIHIAPGLKVDGTILEKGHDYTLTESAENADHYEFETETVHPMLVNSSDTITYGGNGDSIITATNKRRGDIEIRKNVVDLSGKNISTDSIVKDIPFTFTLQTLDLPNGQKNVSAQRYHISHNETTGVEVETPIDPPFNVKQGYTFDITTSQKVKLLNVPIGTKYEIVETAKPGYALDTEKTTGTSGTTEADTKYVAQFTNKMTSMDVTFLKASKKNQNQHLYGVKLQITRTVNGGEQPVVITDKTDTKGYFVIKDTMKDTGMTLPLTDGIYTVKEVQAPDGYQLLTDAFHFTIQGGKVRFTDLDDVKFTAKGNTFTVLNTPGIALPETGGMGTLMTTMSGVALMLIALGYLILVKRGEKGGLN